MAVTRSGTIGLHARSHVVEEISIAIVHAPILDQHMVAKTAGDWDEPTNHRDVTHITAEVKDLCYFCTEKLKY